MSESKFDALRATIRGYGSCLVAYSGGVDSVFLAKVCHDVLGERSLAVIADSPSLPRRELNEALELAKQFGFPVRVVKSLEFANQDYTSNPENRCYFCKSELFAQLAPIARKEGFNVIFYGENASDIGDVRPGAMAAAEFQVRAPLKEAGLTKADIRLFSSKLGLPTADKPQMACLSSRIPYGESVTPEKLRMIEEAEYQLRDLGFFDVRVRHHELQGSNPGRRPTKTEKSNAQLAGVELMKVQFNPSVLHMARIEVAPSEMSRMLQGDNAARVAAALKKIGYFHVTLDLQGYRRGSANETLSSVKAEASLPGAR